MCDYSLQAVKTRKANVGDKLVVHDFGTGTRGFADASDPTTAVCVLPGTEIAFDRSIQIHHGFLVGGPRDTEPLPNVAVFKQINKEHRLRHHDCLAFADGRERLLTDLQPGQHASILQLPVIPMCPEEAEAQARVEVTEFIHREYTRVPDEYGHIDSSDDELELFV